MSNQSINTAIGSILILVVGYAVVVVVEAIWRAVFGPKKP